MNFFKDRKIKNISKAESIKIPSEFSQMLDETLGGLENKSIKSKRSFSFNIYMKVALAVVFCSFIVFPNISPKISYAMQEIPIVGNLIKIITIRNYFEKDGNSELDVELPKINNADDKSSQIINDDVEKLINKVLENYYAEKDPENHLYVKVNTDVVTNTPKWFTLKLEMSEVRAGSNIRYKIYHIDKTKDKILEISDLFENDVFKKVISNEIKKQMAEEMEKDKSTIYWFQSEVEDWNFKEIKDNQNFYFSENGNIVIVFDKYEVAPGAMGAPQFEVNKDIYKQYLKEEYK